MIVGRNLIAGEWREGTSEIEDRNPSDISDLVGVFSQASSAVVHEAVAAAREAQPQWTATSSYDPREQGRAAIEFYAQMKTSYVYAGPAT
jgi:acyl-CoA reductase-like NAD-dependent aldehyde dehydrogenase